MQRNTFQNVEKSTGAPKGDMLSRVTEKKNLIAHTKKDPILHVPEEMVVIESPIFAKMKKSQGKSNAHTGSFLIMIRRFGSISRKAGKIVQKRLKMQLFAMIEFRRNTAIISIRNKQVGVPPGILTPEILPDSRFHSVLTEKAELEMVLF